MTPKPPQTVALENERKAIDEEPAANHGSPFIGALPTRLVNRIERDTKEGEKVENRTTEPISIEFV